MQASMAAFATTPRRAQSGPGPGELHDRSLESSVSSAHRIFRFILLNYERNIVPAVFWATMSSRDLQEPLLCPPQSPQIASGGPLFFHRRVFLKRIKRMSNKVSEGRRRRFHTGLVLLGIFASAQAMRAQEPGKAGASMHGERYALANDVIDAEWTVTSQHVGQLSIKDK